MPSSKDGDNSGADWGSSSQHSLSTTFTAQRENEERVDPNEAAKDVYFEDQILWGSDPNTSYFAYMMEREKEWRGTDQNKYSLEDSALGVSPVFNGSIDASVTISMSTTKPSNDHFLADAAVVNGPTKVSPPRGIHARNSSRLPAESPQRVEEIPSVIFLGDPPIISSCGSTIGQRGLTLQSKRRLLIGLIVLLMFTLVVSTTLIVLSLGKNKSSVGSLTGAEASSQDDSGLPLNWTATGNVTLGFTNMSSPVVSDMSSPVFSDVSSPVGPTAPSLFKENSTTIVLQWPSPTPIPQDTTNSPTSVHDGNGLTDPPSTLNPIAVPADKFPGPSTLTISLLETNSPTPGPILVETPGPTSEPPTLSPTKPPNPTLPPSSQAISSSAPFLTASAMPIDELTLGPSKMPTQPPTQKSTNFPSKRPTPGPTDSPTITPTTPRTPGPTDSPTISPTTPLTPGPTDSPTISPTTPLTPGPTDSPTIKPTKTPPTPPPVETTSPPTFDPTASPTRKPTPDPTPRPSKKPTPGPTDPPTSPPPTTTPTQSTDPPSKKPTPDPTSNPSTPQPTPSPSLTPDPNAPVDASIEVDKTTYMLGDEIAITFNNNPPRSSDWIAMRDLSQGTDSRWVAVLWVWTCGTRTCDGSPSSGTVIFSPGDSVAGNFGQVGVGTYRMYLMRGETSSTVFAPFAKSTDFTIVSESSAASPASAPAAFPTDGD